MRLVDFEHLQVGTREPLRPALPRRPGAQAGKGTAKRLHLPDPAALVAVFQALPEGIESLGPFEILDGRPIRKIPLDPDAELPTHRFRSLVGLLVQPPRIQGEDPGIGPDLRHHGDEDDVLLAETGGESNVRMAFGQGPSEHPFRRRAPEPLPQTVEPLDGDFHQDSPFFMHPYPSDFEFRIPDLSEPGPRP